MFDPSLTFCCRCAAVPSMVVERIPASLQESTKRKCLRFQAIPDFGFEIPDTNKRIFLSCVKPPSTLSYSDLIGSRLFGYHDEVGTNDCPASRHLLDLLTPKHVTQIFEMPTGFEHKDLLAPSPSPAKSKGRQKRQVTDRACHPERMRGV